MVSCRRTGIGENPGIVFEFPFRFRLSVSEVEVVHQQPLAADFSTGISVVDFLLYYRSGRKRSTRARPAFPTPCCWLEDRGVEGPFRVLRVLCWTVVVNEKRNR